MSVFMYNHVSLPHSIVLVYILLKRKLFFYCATLGLYASRMYMLSACVHISLSVCLSGYLSQACVLAKYLRL